MEILQHFMAYAQAFEETYKDDDWSRLRQYFAPDAVYDVQAKGFGCHLVGPDAIFAGIKKSLDGFDRRFDTRDIAITSPPEVIGDEMRVGWQMTYRKAGVPDFVLAGRSSARYAGGRIAQLVDSYEPEAERAFETWQRQSGMKIDASYV